MTDNLDLPSSLSLERRGAVAVLTLDRASKRNALDAATVRALGAFFMTPPSWAKVVVLAADGDHFSAGLDLNDLSEQDAEAGLHYSRMWHTAFGHLEQGRLPVIAVLKGAVVGGGLELAASTHIRVAEQSAFFALPEGQRGIFVGGGASVRLPRLIGTQRVMDMMLTGRVYGADEAAALGLAQYVVKNGDGLERALELADKVAANAPLTNYAILHALPRIAEAPPETGLLLESLMSAIALSSSEATERMGEFLAGRAKPVVSSAEA